MQAIVVKNGYGLENVVLAEISKPVPKPNEVLVKVESIALNQLDLMIAKGAFAIELPHVLSSDAVGVVEEVGAEVIALKVGDVVATHFIQTWQSGVLRACDLASTLGTSVTGVFAQYIALPVSSLLKIPKNLSTEQAATLPIAGLTAWQAIVNVGKLKAGQTVLLQGTGGVSIFALQFAKTLGARVIIISSSDEKMQKAQVLGADATVNYKTYPDWEQKVLELTDNQGVDLALEISWAEIGKTVATMKIGGRISVVGLLGGADANLSVFPIMQKSLSINGINVGSKTSFEEMNRAIEVNNIKPVIDRVFPLEEFSQALAYFEQSKHFGKVVINFE